MKVSQIKDIAGRVALVIPREVYRGFTIYESYPGYYNVAELPDWDDVFNDLGELKEYIDFCFCVEG